ncbi:MAG: hypothetical protein CMJ18_00650 [Phycisphaeraceae bacterium]|nr:hypothetical protein [Phycisphaeraceae bacterium]
MGHFIGLDLGGTNVKAGLVDDEANVMANLSVPTEGEGGADRVIEVMASAAKEVAAKAGVKMDRVAGIGIGAPGPLDFEAGVVKAAPNLPGWIDVRLRDRIAEATGCPAVLENDANAAAFGEFWAGAGRDPDIRHLVMLTLGTGIGSGLIVDGRVIHGGYGLGGEGGHIIVQPDGRLCGCGQRGCLEAYTSAAQAARRAQEALDAGEDSVLGRISAGQQGEITAEDVFDAAAGGDALALRIVDETAQYLGIAAVTFCRLLDPQMIVFAGGMIAAGDFLFDRIRRSFSDHDWDLVAPQVRIVPATLGNDAGFIGAAAVAWDHDRR